MDDREKSTMKIRQFLNSIQLLLYFIQGTIYQYKQQKLIQRIIIFRLATMGGTVCKQCNDLSLVQYSPKTTINKNKEEYPQRKLTNYQPHIQNASQFRLMSTLNTLSKIKVKEKKVISFQILEQSFQVAEKMEVDLRDTGSKIKKSVDQDKRYQMACVQFGNKRDTTILNIVFIDLIQDNYMYIVAFAGVQKDNRREKGMYFLFKPNEVVIFNGVFGEKNVGLKITKTEEMLERHWGRFNQNFQAEGEGQAIIITKTQEGVEQQHFSGKFLKGKRQGKGNTKILFKTNNDDLTKTFANNKLLKVQQQLTNSKRSIQKMTEDITSFIITASLYNPLRPQQKSNNYFDLLISSTWKNNQIQGLTQQLWPSKNIRFQGMYKNNQRNGYGEQYYYDQIIAKGFYKNGTMQTHKDNQYLLMGFKLVEGQWIRSKGAI